jgi:hypothetical protein
MVSTIEQDQVKQSLHYDIKDLYGMGRRRDVALALIETLGANEAQALGEEMIIQASEKSENNDSTRH